MSKFVLPMPDFNRIHQVIHGTIQNEANPGKACTLFSCIGALILTKHYGMKAQAVAGGFALCVEPNNAMFFGRNDDGYMAYDRDAFHMWVQTETHIFDFMSPVFNEAFEGVENRVAIPRKMFQKRLSDEAASLGDVVEPGQFFSMPDPDLTEELIDSILGRAINRDVIEIADHWFGSRRGKQKPSIVMGSTDGPPRNLTLPNTVSRTAW